MGLLIDTNVFIAAERSRRSGHLPRLLAQIPERFARKEAFLSVVSASELLIGVHRAATPDIRERRHAFVEAILSEFHAIPIDIRIARTHARLASRLAAEGKAVGAHDSWIAATALAYGHALATENTRDFAPVPGLEILPVRLGGGDGG